MNSNDEQQNDFYPGTTLLNLCGCRLLATPQGYQVGIWRDLDGTELRAALRNVHLQEVDVVFLDGIDIPADYKVRKCPARYAGESFANWKRRAEAMRAAERSKQCA